AKTAAIPDHFMRAIVARRAGHPAARMRSRAAHVEPLHRAAVGAVAEDRPGTPQLVKRHMPMHDVAACKAKLALQAFGRKDLAAEDRGTKTGRMGFDRVDDRIGGTLLFLVPVSPSRQFRRELLTEQARHMAPAGREA